MAETTGMEWQRSRRGEGIRAAANAPGVVRGKANPSGGRGKPHSVPWRTVVASARLARQRRPARDLREGDETALREQVQQAARRTHSPGL